MQWGVDEVRRGRNGPWGRTDSLIYCRNARVNMGEEGHGQTRSVRGGVPLAKAAVVGVLGAWFRLPPAPLQAALVVTAAGLDR